MWQIETPLDRLDKGLKGIKSWTDGIDKNNNDNRFRDNFKY